MLRFSCRSGLGRRFAVPSRRCQSTTATVAKSASVWSSSAVLGIAVATGAVGWSVARWQTDGKSGKWRSEVFSSTGGEKRFATLSEMNKASSLLTVVQRIYYLQKMNRRLMRLSQKLEIQKLFLQMTNSSRRTATLNGHQSTPKPCLSPSPTHATPRTWPPLRESATSAACL